MFKTQIDVDSDLMLLTLVLQLERGQVNKNLHLTFQRCERLFRNDNPSCEREWKSKDKEQLPKRRERRQLFLASD